ncbi:MAG: bifunctional folylpolyglutamate synthase/dihydrofolate synthase [Synechococcaceae cyanobacterium]|nr:bifunctional folylpolyglutamate synthase/dihydrofolate synthase [Synechococcaceae cyanobacterium]
MNRPPVPPPPVDLLPPPVELGDLLEPFARRGVDLGLERIRAALAEAGHPERRFAAVQVAGTNGKGSICTMLHAILRAAGVRCGTYRSPHLVSWCERIQIDDSWIAPGLLRADLARWRPRAARHGLTPFELLTAVAFDRFACEGVPLAVLEVGLGGRLDATTAHPARRLVGFAAIGLDQREHLGDPVAAIAREKAGVLAPGTLAFSGPQPSAAAAVLEAEARRRGADLRWVEPLAPAREGGPSLGLPGDLQRANAAVAVALAEALANDGSSIDGGAILRGLAAARWPGRLERRALQGRPLLLDGAHNPPAAEALRRELDAMAPPPPQPRRWLIGIQRHKEGPAVLERLLAPPDRAAIVPLADHPSWTAAELGSHLPDLAERLHPVATAAEGLDWLRADGPLPVVTGSLHLLGAVLPLLDPPVVSG